MHVWIRYDISHNGKIEVPYRGRVMAEDKGAVKRSCNKLWSGEFVQDTASLVVFQYTHDDPLHVTPPDCRGVVWVKTKVSSKVKPSLLKRIRQWKWKERKAIRAASSIGVCDVRLNPQKKERRRQNDQRTEDHQGHK